MFLADQMEAFYYSRIKYFSEHVLHLKTSMKVKRLITMVWLGFFLARVKHMARDRYFVTIAQPSSFTRFLSRMFYKVIKGFIGLFKNLPVLRTAYSKLS